MENDKKLKALQRILEIVCNSTDIEEAAKEIKEYMDEEFGTNE